jgi:hypothetical protein
MDYGAGSIASVDVSIHVSDEDGFGLVYQDEILRRAHALAPLPPTSVVRGEIRWIGRIHGFLHGRDEKGERLRRRGDDGLSAVVPL